MHRTARLFLAATLGSVALAGIPAAIAQSMPAQAADEAYVLGPDDVIDVRIYGQFQEPFRVRIRSDGGITLPLIGNVAAAGQTPGRLAETIRKQYVDNRIFNNAIVNVEVVSYVSRSATVLGAVRTPGILPLVRPTRLTTLIAQAGGQNTGSSIVVLRRPGMAEQRLVISQIAGTDADPIVQAGDVVIVPAEVRFFVYGQVRAPGAFTLEPGMTLRQALASAGGQNDAGTERSIRLYRNGQEMSADKLDELVQPGDVLYIRTRLL